VEGKAFVEGTGTFDFVAIDSVTLEKFHADVRNSQITLVVLFLIVAFVVLRLAEKPIFFP
jgi:hypothetical protein